MFSISFFFFSIFFLLFSIIFPLFPSFSLSSSLLIPSQYSYFSLFRILDLPSIITCIESILSERKLVLYSSHLSLLTLAAESLTGLIYPLAWHHVYIPVVPASLVAYLQAPMPYIMGVPASLRHLEPPPPDAVVVDLDLATVTVGSDPPTPLPPRLRRKLDARLPLIACTAGRGNPADHASPFEAFPGGKCVPVTSTSTREKYEKAHVAEKAVHVGGQPVVSVTDESGVADSASDIYRPRSRTVGSTATTQTTNTTNTSMTSSMTSQKTSAMSQRPLPAVPVAPPPLPRRGSTAEAAATKEANKDDEPPPPPRPPRPTHGHVVDGEGAAVARAATVRVATGAQMRPKGPRPLEGGGAQDDFYMSLVSGATAAVRKME